MQGGGVEGVGGVENAENMEDDYGRDLRYFCVGGELMIAKR